MNPIRTTGTLAALGLAVLAYAASPAQADPPAMGMGMQHPGMGMTAHGEMGMGMDHHAMGMGMMGHGGMGHEMRPHNAAVHFLMMADALGLDDTQKDKLRKLRDDWIETNSTNEERLEAAQADLNAMLTADTFDLKPVDAQLAIVGKIEGQLWHAFAAQLKGIKDLLTDDQRARLRDHHRMGGSGMGMGPGMMDPGMMGTGYDE